MDMELFAQTLTLNLGISQPDNVKLLEMISEKCPMNIIQYETGRTHNGWGIPHEWHIDKALVKQDDKVLFDGTCHFMAVAGSSDSFVGRVTKAELDENVYYDKEYPHAYRFHTVFNYRPWQKHWGFCIPWEIYKDFNDGDYDIELETRFEKGHMVVGEYNHTGKSSDKFVFNAHTCHPCQANDDMAGVIVIHELFKWLKGRDTRYSYRGILAAEHIGTVFYIADLPEEELETIKQGVFVEMVGAGQTLQLQRSFEGDNMVDKLLTQALQELCPDFNSGAFRTIVGNDETVWEAPGVEIPFASLSRWPYVEYHLSDDNIDIMDVDYLNQSLEVLKLLVDILESDFIPVRKFKGLICLSNPEIDLYIEGHDPAIPREFSHLEKELRRVQDALPRYFDGKHSVFEIALKFGISYKILRNYLQKWVDKDLLEEREIPGMDWYDRNKE